MAKEIIYSPRADAQFKRLERYLAERFYPDNARQFIERLRRFCRELALVPSAGKLRIDLRPGIRTVGFERKVDIYYKVAGDQVFILSIHFRGHQPPPG
jgi:toxin ParE1/3/4